MLRYLGGTVTSTFKDGTVGCGGWSVSPGFLGCGGLSGASSTSFVLYLNDLSSEALSLTSTL